MKEKNKMKHGVTLAAVAFGFLMSSGVGMGQRSCPSGLTWCPSTQSCQQSCPSVRFEAQPETSYILPYTTEFRCDNHLPPVPKENGFFACEEKESQKSKSKKSPKE